MRTAAMRPGGSRRRALRAIMATSGLRSVLFVCLGNICRSPMAESIFVKQLADRNLTAKWVVDSSALGPWMIGNKADARALTVLRRHGLDSSHRARMTEESDFKKFHFILCMDHSNLEDLRRLAPKGHSAEIILLGSFDELKDEEETGEVIVDPYYSLEEDFEVTYQRCWRSCASFLNSVEGASSS